MNTLTLLLKASYLKTCPDLLFKYEALKSKVRVLIAHHKKTVDTLIKSGKGRPMDVDGAIFKLFEEKMGNDLIVRPSTMLDTVAAPAAAAPKIKPSNHSIPNVYSVSNN